MTSRLGVLAAVMVVGPLGALSAQNAPRTAGLGAAFGLWLALAHFGVFAIVSNTCIPRN